MKTTLIRSKLQARMRLVPNLQGLADEQIARIAMEYAMARIVHDCAGRAAQN